MKLSKVNRERRQIIYFTDRRGIPREAVVIRDNLNTAKKPPYWMQEIMNNDIFQEFQAEKGA